MHFHHYHKKNVRKKDHLRPPTRSIPKHPHNYHHPPQQQQPGQVPLPQYHQQPVLVDHHKSFAEEMFAVQPYINNLFMLIVLGMLYDIRQAALDCKLYMVKHSM